MQQRDSLGYTLGVAAVLCVVCSLAVSAAAVILKPYQDANRKLDQQKNILDATGLAIGEYGVSASELDKEQIDRLSSWISAELVDLETGEPNTELDVDTYDALEAASKEASSVPIEGVKYDPGEPRREKVAKVFFVRRDGKGPIQQVVLPVYGKGLWGTLYGYLAVKSDLQTSQGLTFHTHKETPGLGGEVDNPDWKAQWDGVKLYDETGEPAAFVFKGPAPDGNPYAVDGLSGATITSRGVTMLLRYWLSDDGYGPFMAKLKERIENGDEVTTDEPVDELAADETETQSPPADTKAAAEPKAEAAEPKAEAKEDAADEETTAEEDAKAESDESEDAAEADAEGDDDEAETPEADKPETADDGGDK